MVEWRGTRGADGWAAVPSGTVACEAGPVKPPVLASVDNAWMLPALPICKTDELVTEPIRN
ncbi:hypothetical protein B4114_0616 [Geobacillus stearothermophilus]|uniref:Uncharacterized protein n=1 Tax=Geobacillus stearothermophilus TaxID=1422 RepID=A0A150N390_GEOSE|nr:hypothetical protein B4114_0616 [Geobacillus stearothermophilus]